MRTIGLLGVSGEIINRYSGINVPVISYADFDKLDKYGSQPFVFVELQKFDVKEIRTNINWLIAKKSFLCSKLTHEISSEIVVIEDVEGLKIGSCIGIDSGDYSVIDFRSSENFFRYIIKMRNEKGIFIFKKILSKEELLHFLISLFLAVELV